MPFVAITLLAGLQTISPSYYEAASLDGASPWQQFRYVTLPLLTPIIAVVMTFSVLFTFTDFQLIYVLTRGGPLNATHLMATLSFQRAIPGGSLGEGAAIATAMVPFLLAAILFSYFGLQRRAWQQGAAGLNEHGGGRAGAADSQGMNYLVSLPRRIVTVYLPLGAFLFVLLFPFYWMVITDVQAGRGAAVARGQSVLGAQSDARARQEAAVRHRVSGMAVEHDPGFGRVDVPVDRLQRARRLRDRAAALSRFALRRHEHLSRLPRAAVDPVHSAGGDRLQAATCSTRGWR